MDRIRISRAAVLAAAALGCGCAQVQTTHATCVPLTIAATSVARAATQPPAKQTTTPRSEPLAAEQAIETEALRLAYEEVDGWAAAWDQIVASARADDSDRQPRADDSDAPLAAPVEAALPKAEQDAAAQRERIVELERQLGELEKQAEDRERQALESASTSAALGAYMALAVQRAQLLGIVVALRQAQLPAPSRRPFGAVEGSNVEQPAVPE